MIFSELQAGAKLVIGIAIFTFIVGSITAVYFWHRSKVNTAVATAVDKIRLEQALQNLKLKERETEATWELDKNILTIRKAKDEQIKVASAKYNSLLEWVRRQPSSTGSPSVSADNPGVAESRPEDHLAILYRQNAVDLAEYAKDAEAVRLELLACYSSYDAVKAAQDDYKKNNAKAKAK